MLQREYRRELSMSLAQEVRKVASGKDPLGRNCVRDFSDKL